MNKNKPVSNKFLNKIWQEYDKHMHRKNLREIASTNEVLMRTPQQMPHIGPNGK